VTSNLTNEMIPDLKNIPGTQEIIQKILQENIDILEQSSLLAEEKDNATQREKAINLGMIGDSLVGLADIQKNSKKYEEALKQYQHALEFFERLAVDSANTQAQKDLAICYRRIGEVQTNLGKYEEALKHYQQVLDICKRLAENKPNDLQTHIQHPFFLF